MAAPILGKIEDLIASGKARHYSDFGLGTNKLFWRGVDRYEFETGHFARHMLTIQSQGLYWLLLRHNVSGGRSDIFGSQRSTAIKIDRKTGKYLDQDSLAHVWESAGFNQGEMKEITNPRAQTPIIDGMHSYVSRFHAKLGL